MAYPDPKIVTVAAPTNPVNPNPPASMQIRTLNGANPALRRHPEWRPTVQDDLSTNGTTVNDVDLKAYDPCRLSDGDKITLGLVATFYLRRVKLR